MSPTPWELPSPLTRCRPPHCATPVPPVTPSPSPYLSLCLHHEGDVLNADPELAVPVIPGL